MHAIYGPEAFTVSSDTNLQAFSGWHGVRTNNYNIRALAANDYLTVSNNTYSVCYRYTGSRVFVDQQINSDFYLSAQSNGVEAGLVCRMDSSANGYVAYAVTESAGSSIRIYRLSNNGGTWNFLTSSSVSFPTDQWSSMYFKVTGNATCSLEFKVGNSTLTYLDSASTRLTTGNPGIELYRGGGVSEGSARHDNITIYSFRSNPTKLQVSPLKIVALTGGSGTPTAGVWTTDSISPEAGSFLIVDFTFRCDSEPELSKVALAYDSLTWTLKRQQQYALVVGGNRLATRFYTTASASPVPGPITITYSGTGTLVRGKWAVYQVTGYDPNDLFGASGYNYNDATATSLSVTITPDGEEKPGDAIIASLMKEDHLNHGEAGELDWNPLISLLDGNEVEILSQYWTKRPLDLTWRCTWSTNNAAGVAFADVIHANPAGRDASARYSIVQPSGTTSVKIKQ